MDDYTVYAMLKNSKKSKSIISDLENRRMLKCAYEKTFYEKDTMVSNIFNREVYRKQLQSEIAEEANIEANMVVIDVPTVPSVPYEHSVLTESMEIPMFYKTAEGKKIPQRLSEISKIFDTLRGFMNILRVYTTTEEREKVGKAAEKILGRIPPTAQISY
jgi:HD superfamily phosphohydrolase